MNALFNLLGGGSSFQNSPLGDFMSFMNNFNQFRQNFKGNPQQQIQNLLNSGQISQEQYNDAVRKAQQLQNLIK